MKSTGIVRRVDELGHVVIPMELRRTLGIKEKDPIEIYVDGVKIVLKKYEPSVDREEKEQVIKDLKRIENHANNPNLKATIRRAISFLTS